MLDLINGVLDISKIESGKMELYCESFNIHRLFSEISSTVSPLMNQNSNQLKVDCQEDIGFMHSDLLKIRQIIFNLLSNSAKFTEHGEITLAVEKVKNFVRFHVCDTGIGMNDEQMEKVFDPFSQADVSTTRKYGGTGLGLSITQQFCRLLGGDIKVKSEYGQGSKFTVTLPIDHQAESIGAQELTDQVTKGNDDFSSDESNSYKVMIVDDDPVARDLLQRHLEKDGYQVRTVSEGVEAHQIAKSWQPDVITLDVLMANVDGWTVLSKLKQDATVSHIPVIMVSIVDEKNMGYTLGAADYISKPVQQDVLRQVVAKHLPQLSDLEQLKLLVVDNDEATRAIVRRTFEQLNCDVTEAINGEVGCEVLQEMTPDVILLDLMMPEVDGFEFLDRIKKRDKFKEIPVIVLTAKALTKRDYARLQGRVEKIYEKSEEPLVKILRSLSEQIQSSLMSNKPSSPTTDKRSC